MDAPPYVSMKCSTTSESGQPTPSPAMSGGLPVEFLIEPSREKNPCQVVGADQLLAWKNVVLYQKPGLTFPV